jgi:hypothetical protein
LTIFGVGVGVLVGFGVLVGVAVFVGVAVLVGVGVAVAVAAGVGVAVSVEMLGLASELLDADGVGVEVPAKSEQPARQTVRVAAANEKAGILRRVMVAEL